ncbi:MAG: vitamin B12 dependent methionine synthase [Bacillota bacterium]
MEQAVINEMNFKIDIEELLKTLHIRPGSEHEKRVELLVQDAELIARPKALYRAAYIDDKGDNFVIIDGIKFKSRVLRVNLDSVNRVFPYIATSGREIEEWSETLEGMLEKYWADVIKEKALRAAIMTLESHLVNTFKLGHISKMNPGSLKDWPISEQKNLFKLLKDEQDLIGVELKDSFLMSPIKTVSGIYFPTEVSFVNCQLCPREGCPARKAPFEKELHDNKYSLANH